MNTADSVKNFSDEIRSLTARNPIGQGLLFFEETIKPTPPNQTLRVESIVSQVEDINKAGRTMVGVDWYILDQNDNLIKELKMSDIAAVISGEFNGKYFEFHQLELIDNSNDLLRIQLLRRLCDLADKHQIDLSVTVPALIVISKDKQLGQIIADNLHPFGFVKTKGKNYVRLHN